jgi:hypothetical protein
MHWMRHTLKESSTATSNLPTFLSPSGGMPRFRIFKLQSNGDLQSTIECERPRFSRPPLRTLDSPRWLCRCEVRGRAKPQKGKRTESIHRWS